MRVQEDLRMLPEQIIFWLTDLVGAERLLLDAGEWQYFAVDGTTIWQANPSAVGLPATIEEVQQAVLLKKNYLHYPRSPLKIELMRHIKKALDPNSDLNLGKLFD